jgi:pantoate kinase
MSDEATAFVPGHVTGFFSSHPADDPTKAGSRGAGVTLASGVEVTVRPGEETAIYLNDSSVEMEPVERVLDALETTAVVSAETDLPMGAGFGVSGAMALGTALAVNRAFDRWLSENELVTIAHGAEVQSGTGLGDVVAQAKGGVPIRLEPGGPQDNLLDAIPAPARVEYVSFGEVDTETVISGDTDQLDEAGRQALSRVVGEPTLQSFMYASRHFARDADLLTDRVRDAIRDVNDAGGEAAMAMLGDTVFALGTGLTDAGYDPQVTRTHPAGAQVK